METTELKTLCLIRVPPGDRWKEPNGTEVFESLTIAIEKIYQDTQCKEYRFSATGGKVWLITTEEVAPPEPHRYSIYDDGY